MCRGERRLAALFVELLQSPDEDVWEQAVWALGNIAGESTDFRNLVLQSGGLGGFVNLLAKFGSTERDLDTVQLRPRQATAAARSARWPRSRADASSLTSSEPMPP